MHFLVKWIKFSVKKNKTLKKYWKNGKNTGKVREKSGNFVSPEKWEPCLKRKIGFQFGGGGVFWVRSDLDSGKKIRVFNFQRGWGCVLELNSRTGVFWNLVKNFWKPSLEA